MSSLLCASRRRRSAGSVPGLIALSIVLWWASGARAVAQTTITQSVVFTTSGQSLTGSGSSQSTSYPFNYNLFNTGNISVSMPGSPIGIGSVGSISASGAASASASFNNQLTINPGSISATLPYSVPIAIPAYNTTSGTISGFGTTGGWVISVGTSQFQQGATLTTTSPSLSFSSGLALSMQAQLSGEAQASFLGYNYSGSFDQSVVNLNLTGSNSISLFNYNLNSNGQADGSVAILYSLLQKTPLKNFIDPSAAAGNLLNAGFSQLVPKYQPPVDSSGGTMATSGGTLATTGGTAAASLKFLTFSTGFQSPPIFSTQFSIPSISLGSSASPAYSSTLGISSSGYSQVAQLNINLISLLTQIGPYLGIPVPPLAFQAKLGLGSSEASASLEAANITLAPALNLTQTASITPLQPTVGFNWGTPLSVRILDNSGNPVTPYGMSTSVSGLGPGDSLQFQNPLPAKTTLNLTPIYSANANLTDNFGFTLSSSLNTTLLSAELGAKVFGFSLGKATLGPAYTNSLNLGMSPTLFTFANSSFALGGWQNVTGGDLVLSTEPYTCTTLSSSSLFAAANYRIPSTGGTLPTGPSGQDVVINTMTPSTFYADSQGTVNALTVAGNGQVVINPQITLFETGNLTLSVGNQAGLIVANQGTLQLTSTATTIDAGSGWVQLSGSASVLSAAGNLDVVRGAVLGQGSIQVSGTGGLEMDSGAIVSSGGTLNVSASQLFNGGVRPLLQSMPGSTLQISTPNGSGILGGSGSNVMLLNAGGSSTISLLVSSVSGAEVTSGSGTMVLGRNMSLSAFSLDSGANVQTANGCQVTLNDSAFVNNGLLKATSGSTLYLPAGASAAVTLTGAGVVQLDSATLTGASDSALVNDVSHTILLTGSGVSQLGTDSSGNGPSVLNLGTIESDMGPAGVANLRAPNAAGAFANMGTLRGNNGATLTLASGEFYNAGLFEAGQVTFGASSSKTVNSGSIIMTTSATLDNLTASGSTLTLNGGVYRLDSSSSSMGLNGPAASGTNFLNQAYIQMLGSGSGAQNFTVNGTALANMNSFANGGSGSLALGPGASFITAQLVNDGLLQLYGTEQTPVSVLGNVLNNSDGTVAIYPGRQAASPTNSPVSSSAFVQFYSQGGAAVNLGLVTVDGTGDPNMINATIGGDGNATSFSNSGTIVVTGANATLSFASSLSVAHNGTDGGDPSFQGGTWIANSGTINLGLAAAPLVLDANVTLVGPGTLFVNNATTLEAAINRIGSAGQLYLNGHNATFAGGLTNQGLLNLNNGSTVTAPLILNSALITGGGTIASPNYPNDYTGAGLGASIINAPITNDGTIQAVAGQLTFKQNVDNTGGLIWAIGVSGGSPAIAAGGIGLDGGANQGGVNNVVITGGMIQIDYGAALWGYGRIAAPQSLINNGTIMANDFYRLAASTSATMNYPAVGLTVEINQNVHNHGQMVATAGNWLYLTPQPGIVSTGLDNASGTLSVQYVTPNYGGLSNLNGHLVIGNTTAGAANTTTTVNRGVLLVQGGDVPDLPDPAASAAIRATVDGNNAVLNGVAIQVYNGVLRSQSDGQFFTIIPSGSDAAIYDSLVLADSGGILMLSGAGPGLQHYSLPSTLVLAQGAGAMQNSSSIDIGSVELSDGSLATASGGVIALVGSNVRFTYMSNSAPLTVGNGTTLQLAKTFYCAGGTLDVNGGSLSLDGSQPIGGGTNSGCDVLGGYLRIRQGSSLSVCGTARIIGSQVNNEGLLQLGAGQNLAIITSMDSPNPASSVLSSGTIAVAGTTLAIQSVVVVSSTSNTQARGLLSQSGGITNVSAGGLLDADMDLGGGTLTGNSALSGALSQSGGVFAPGAGTPAVFSVGSYNLAEGSLYVQIASPVLFGQVATGGNVSLGALGDIVLDMSSVPPSDPIFQAPPGSELAFQLFQVPTNATITDNDVPFDLIGGGRYQVESFDTNTGTVYLEIVPEPRSLALLAAAAVGLLLLARARLRRQPVAGHVP
jgi:hypothetical protein